MLSATKNILKEISLNGSDIMCDRESPEVSLRLTEFNWHASLHYRLPTTGCRKPSRRMEERASLVYDATIGISGFYFVFYTTFVQQIRDLK